MADAADAAGDAENTVDRVTRQRLARSYGSHHRRVLDAMVDTPRLAATLSDTCPVTRGEVLHAVRHEMAVRLEDAMLRRTETGSAGHPGRDALEAAARIMGAELGWDETQMAQELSHVERVYRLDP